MGVEIETITPGDGRTFPKKGQCVVVHYVGKVHSAGLNRMSPDIRVQYTFNTFIGYAYTEVEFTQTTKSTLADGKVFDSSRQRGRPFKFKIGKQEVIRGWEEGVAQMSVGQRAKLVCSPDYAYGIKGHPGIIPSNATLTFDVELLSLEV